MKEVRIYGSLLAVLLIAAFFSWSRETPSGSEFGADEKVVILDAPKESIKALNLYTKTQTVAFSLKKDEGAKSYAWFTVEQNQRKRSFAGNDKVDKLIESFAPFKGLRSLGKLTGAELAETKLDKPERKLVIGLKNGDKVFELGGRTSGARDHYVRAQGGSEVFLVASQVLGDFEFPEGRFMERRLKEPALRDVSKVIISANGKAKTILHKNRLAQSDSFWASDSKPDEKSETLGNYVDKLDRLTAIEYANDDAPYPKQGTPVLTSTWHGEDDKSVATIEIYKAGEKDKSEYYALSSLTRVPVKISKFMADQLERDLASVLAN